MNHPFFILFLCCMLTSCGKSNEVYRNEVEKNLTHLLVRGTEKAEILDFLHKNHYQFTAISQTQCQKFQIKHDEQCTKGGYIVWRQAFKKWLNPVESGAYIRINFDEFDRLEDYHIKINHSFLYPLKPNPAHTLLHTGAEAEFIAPCANALFDGL